MQQPQRCPRSGSSASRPPAKLYQTDRRCRVRHRSVRPRGQFSARVVERHRQRPFPYPSPVQLRRADRRGHAERHGVSGAGADRLSRRMGLSWRNDSVCRTMAAGMITLRFARDIITGLPVDRDTRRARLLSACRDPIGSVPGAASSPAIGIRETSWAHSAVGAIAFIAQ